MRQIYYIRIFVFLGSKNVFAVTKNVNACLVILHWNTFPFAKRYHYYNKNFGSIKKIIVFSFSRPLIVHPYYVYIFYKVSIFIETTVFSFYSFNPLKINAWSCLKLMNCNIMRHSRKNSLDNILIITDI